MVKHPKFRVTYELDGTRLSNIIDPATSDIHWLFDVQRSVAYDWGWKLLTKRIPNPIAQPSISDVNAVSKLISIEQVE